MNLSAWRRLGLSAFLALASGCGGPGAQVAQSGGAGATAVDIAGQVSERGTRGSILVFAHTDLAPTDDVAVHEAASVSTLTADGVFDLEVGPCASLSLVFLADGSNDGVVDEGDPVAVLNAPELADLRGGDHVQLSDVSIDFHAHRVTAAVEVARAAGGPETTPTPVPGS